MNQKTLSYEKVKRKLLILILAFFVCRSYGQTSVQFNLADPQFGISQTTNRTIVLQAESGTSISGGVVLLPFQLRAVTDTNGQYTFTNLFGSAISGYYHWTVPAPPQMAQGDIWVQSTNLGLVEASTIMGVFGASTYPAAVFAWGAQQSDARYGPSTSATTNFPTFTYLYNVSNVLAAATLTQGGASTNFTLSTSNALASQISTNTTGQTSAQVTNIVQNLILTSNLTTYAAIANTNYANLVTATGLISSASNSIQSAYLGVVYSASNAVASGAASSLQASNAAVVIYISTNNPTVAALILTNQQILTVATNLSAVSSNNLQSYATGVSNNVVAEHSFAVVISNSVNSASNTLAAGAVSQVAAAASAQSAALVATNGQIIAYVNSYVASTTNGQTTALYGAISAASNTVAANSLSQLVSSNAAQSAALVATNGQIISYVGTYTGTAIGTATNGIGATITLTSNALQTQSFAISNSLIITVNLASNANAGYALAVSNNDASTLGFAKGVSNSVVYGTNQIAAFALASIQLTNNANLGTNVINLINTSNALTSALNASNVLQTAANAVLSNAVTAALALTNVQIQAAASNTALANISYTNQNTLSLLSIDTNTIMGIFAQNLYATNSTNLFITTNLVLNTSNAVIAVATNGFTAATNYSATINSNFVSSSTNVIGVTGAGSMAANGTYVGVATGTTWTNQASASFIIVLSGTTWSIQSNSITLYILSGIPGTVTAVNGISPVPNVFYGRFHNYSGDVATGAVPWSSPTNTTWGVAATYTSAARPMQLYLYVSNGIPTHYLLINTN